MKKRILSFIIISIVLISASCNKHNKNDDYNYTSSKDFMENTSTPERLSIDVDFDAIKYVDNARTYQAEYIEFDKQKLIDAFLKNPVKEEKIWAEGPQIISSSDNIKEILSIYDGGKSFGTDTGMKGSFFYSKTFDDIPWEKLDAVADISFEDLSYNDEFRRNSDYDSYIDLNFFSYEESLLDIEEILETAGISHFDIDEAYSLDLDTMKAHFELYRNSHNVDSNLKNTSWTKEDECYIFSLRQMVDDIAIVNKEWQMPDGTKASVWGNAMPATKIHLVYNKSGINKIEAHNIVKITKEIKDNNLISVYEALNTLIQDYSLTILEDDIHIVSAELCYLNIPDNDKIELVPGWIFISVKEIVLDGKSYTQYKYDAVNAVTGKLYQDRW